VTRESLKISEEAWQHYCKAWIALARERYPSVSVQDWKTWLDQDRLVALSRFIH